MKFCPYATGVFGCGALKSVGYASGTITISETWRNDYCTSGKYPQCPNLKTAREMQKNNKQESKGSHIPAQGPSSSRSGAYDKSPNNNPRVKEKKKTTGQFDPVHAHGGVPPHFCEKPWRSGDLRFRVTRSLFYQKPWK